MATQAQIDANRKNAEKSTGPKTPEGKAKSCMNRRSHGFTSSLGFLKFEDCEEFNALLADLTREFQPATPNEQILVEKMAQSQWTSLRATRIQSELIAKYGVAGSQSRLNAMLDYQTASDRAFHRAHKELLKAKKLRPKTAPTPEVPQKQHKLFLVKR